MKSKGILLVVSGPSGVGKGTVMRELFKMRDDLRFSISATTRQPREGEEDGVHYHFLTKEAFEALKKDDGFLESAQFCDNSYGTLKSEVFPYLEEGVSVVLEIEVQGAMQVKEKYPEGVFLYIAPPSLQELSERLYGRGTESDEVIEKRLTQAKWELTKINEYDYIILNDEVLTAADKINAVIKAEKSRVKMCSDILGKIQGGKDL